MGIILLRSMLRARSAGGRSLFVLSSTLAALLVVTPAHAQGAKDDKSSGQTTVAPPGSITIERDVPHRNMAKAYEPGIVTFARTDPGVEAFTDQIDELIPISDVESATMGADLPFDTTLSSAARTIDVTLNASLSGALTRGAADPQFAPGSAFGEAMGGATGALTGVVDAGMGALEGAMAPLANLPGGGH
ncbi:hypothetical protein [Sphingosinicella humi]|uniref:Uncharacterized protein n=1 Tax=Allosphingosinicella humi TaxID=2068657 RepID=A0A2U2J1B2_9SPHN|nr:hypothetical protein [Sphingosinicella humi]PWG02117.1 hypothetical protein DF286_03970 [Sphingosinicella humi]